MARPEQPSLRFASNTWMRTVSECLWSSATQIRGRVALKDLYPNLDDFFVGSLGVQGLTLDMPRVRVAGRTTGLSPCPC